MYERRIPFTMRALLQLSQEGLFNYQLEPETGDFAYLLFDSGVKHYVSRADIRVNFVGPHEIVKRKYVTDQFLQQAGFPVIPSKLFFNQELIELYEIQNGGSTDAIEYAKELGYPLIIKPNDGFHGKNIFKANSESELVYAIENIFEHKNRLLVQKYFKANDYRLVVYRGKFQFAYQRTPLTMVGDGKQTILEYVEAVERQAIKKGKDVKINRDSVLLVVARLGYTLESVPDLGEMVQLLDNANLSTGGSALDVTSLVHPKLLSLIEKIGETFNLNLTGIDLLVNGDISEDPDNNEWAILEVNGSPGFEGFASLGQEQEKRVIDMFREIVQDISEGHYATYLPKK
jgi:D-alanine-D-alanine ligase-like ATP-grasp enzyme